MFQHDSLLVNFKEDLMKLFRKTKNFIWLVLFFLLSSAAPVFSQSEKEKDIKKLLEVSGILRVLSNSRRPF